MISDRSKLLLLVVLTVVCLGTIFTSPSTTMGNPNMRVLSPPVRQFCKAPREAAADKGCSNAKHSSEKPQECSSLMKAVQTCDRMLQRAFQHINLGGCPFQIKAVTLCEDEWCRHDPKSCMEECSGVRESLSVCTQQQVSSYFQRHGLKENGTPL